MSNKGVADPNAPQYVAVSNLIVGTNGEPAPDADELYARFPDFDVETVVSYDFQTYPYLHLACGKRDLPMVRALVEVCGADVKRRGTFSLCGCNSHPPSLPPSAPNHQLTITCT